MALRVVPSPARKVQSQRVDHVAAFGASPELFPMATLWLLLRLSVGVALFLALLSRESPLLLRLWMRARLCGATFLRMSATALRLFCRGNCRWFSGCGYLWMRFCGATFLCMSAVALRVDQSGFQAVVASRGAATRSPPSAAARLSAAMGTPAAGGRRHRLVHREVSGRDLPRSLPRNLSRSTATPVGGVRSSHEVDPR